MTTIQTDRLLIRDFSVDDWEALHETIQQYQASEVAAYDHPWPTSADEIRGIAAWFAGGDSFLAVCLKDTGRFIGFVSLNPEEKEGAREYNLGYVFNFGYHGLGYATEACRAALNHAFDQLQADGVVTGTAAANIPSCRLLQQYPFTEEWRKCGTVSWSGWLSFRCSCVPVKHRRRRHVALP